MRSLANPYNRSGRPYRLYEPLEQWARTNHVESPQVEGLANIFIEASKMYYTNFCNNIWMHAKGRMRKFFLIVAWAQQQQHQQQITKAQIEQTLRFLFYTQGDNVAPNQDLLDAFKNQLLSQMAILIDHGAVTFGT